MWQYLNIRRYKQLKWNMVIWSDFWSKHLLPECPISVAKPLLWEWCPGSMEAGNMLLSRESHLRSSHLSCPSVKSTCERERHREGSLTVPLPSWRQCPMSCQWGGGKGTSLTSVWPTWGAPASSPISPPSPPSSSPPTSWGRQALNFGTRGRLRSTNLSTTAVRSRGSLSAPLLTDEIEPLRNFHPPPHLLSQALAGFPGMVIRGDSDKITRWHDDKMNCRFSCFSTTTSTFASATSFDGPASHFQVGPSDQVDVLPSNYTISCSFNDALWLISGIFLNYLFPELH